MNLSERQIAEYRLEVLRERNHIEADIAQSLRRILSAHGSLHSKLPVSALQIMTVGSVCSRVREESLLRIRNLAPDDVLPPGRRR